MKLRRIHDRRHTDRTVTFASGFPKNNLVVDLAERIYAFIPPPFNSAEDA